MISLVTDYHNKKLVVRYTKGVTDLTVLVENIAKLPGYKQAF